MNTRLVLIAACVCGLAVGLIVRQTSRSQTQRPEGLPERAAGASEGAVRGATTEPPAEGLSSERTPAAGRPVDSGAAGNVPMAPVSVARPGEAAGAGEAVAASAPLRVDSAEIPADPYGFEAKYAAHDPAQILGALDAINSVLTAQREGQYGDKSQALPAEELAALELEQQWLKHKAYP